MNFWMIYLILTFASFIIGFFLGVIGELILYIYYRGDISWHDCLACGLGCLFGGIITIPFELYLLTKQLI